MKLKNLLDQYAGNYFGVTFTLKDFVMGFALLIVVLVLIKKVFI